MCYSSVTGGIDGATIHCASTQVIGGAKDGFVSLERCLGVVYRFIGDVCSVPKLVSR